MLAKDLDSWMASSNQAPSSTDPHGELMERVEDASRLLRSLVPSTAFALCAWESMSGTHLHRTLISDGYADDVLAHLNDGYVKDNPAFHMLYSKVPHTLRWKDLTRNWNYDFSATYICEEFLLPAGIHEGITACLRLRDGRYTGSLHMSWAKPSEATDERQETAERFRPVLAAICDILRTPQIIREHLAPEAMAIVVSADGTTAELPGENSGSVLAEESPLRKYLAASAGAQRRRRFLWPDQLGSCFKVEVIPCKDDVSLATATYTPWPYGLTMRELEILHLVSGGHSNPQIAQLLYVSPRTVSTHIEHILAKTECSSRAQLAAVAINDGLLLAQSPAVGHPAHA